MKYPSEFPLAAQAKVEAEALRAYDELEQDVRCVGSGRRDAPFIRCVMRVFLAFAREACTFGKKSHHPEWFAGELNQRCRDFLLSVVIDAWEDKAKDLGVQRMFTSAHHAYSLDDDARRKIEKTPEWKQYLDLLRDAFDAQSGDSEQHGHPASKTEVSESKAPQYVVTELPPEGLAALGASAADCNPPELEQVGGAAPETGTAESSSPCSTPTEHQQSSPARKPSSAAAGTTEQERRRAVVDPILKQKQWTVNRWGTKAGVGKNCAYDYLRCKRTLSSANRQALAEVLGLKAEELPNSLVSVPDNPTMLPGETQ